MKIIIEFTKEDLKDESTKSESVKLSDFIFDSETYKEADEVRYKNENGGIVYFKASHK